MVRYDDLELSATQAGLGTGPAMVVHPRLKSAMRRDYLTRRRKLSKPTKLGTIRLMICRFHRL